MVKFVTVATYLALFFLGFALTYPMGWYALLVSLPISFAAGVALGTWRDWYKDTGRST